MHFLDREGQKIITIDELFRTKIFIRATNSFYLFTDKEKKEVWTFIDRLSNYIPIDTSAEERKKIVEQTGWCKEIKGLEV